MQERGAFILGMTLLMAMLVARCEAAKIGQPLDVEAPLDTAPGLNGLPSSYEATGQHPQVPPLYR